ncbi:MAG: ComEC/Rec2 family competence protein [Parcubacteria group bacterium]
MAKEHRLLSKSYLFLYFTSSLVGGVVVASFWVPVVWQMLLFFALTILLISVWWKVAWVRTVGFCGLFLLLGVWRLVMAQPADGTDLLRAYNDKEEVIFVGVVVEEPDVRADNVKLTVAGEEILRGESRAGVAGKVLLTVPCYPEFAYGDRLQISGQLKDPGEFDGFSYRDYLAKFGIYSVCYRPQVELVSTGGGNIFQRGLLRVKQRFKEQVELVLPEPQASFLAGMLLGAKGGLPEDVREQFNIVGVSHIIVISGFHVAIVAGLLMNLGLALSLLRRQAFWLAVVGLVLFILLTGAQTSAVRAGIMGGLVLLAMQAGRLSDVKNLLLLAAVVMLLINPLLLRFDVGFQLSFLATIGIVYLSPLITKLLRFLPEALKIRESATMTLSAQVTTLPIIITSFERLSVVAPLANIMIVPLMPLTMMAGFVSGLVSFVSLALGKVLATGAWLLLSYKLMVVEWLARLPYAAVEINDLRWEWWVVYYGTIFFILSWIRKNTRSKKI